MLIHAVAFAAAAQNQTFDVVIDKTLMIIEAQGLQGRTGSGFITLEGPARIRVKGAETSVGLSRRGNYLLVVVGTKDAKGNEAVGGSFEIPVGDSPVKISYDPDAKAYRFEH